MATTAARMSSLTPGMAPASQPLNYTTTTTTSQAAPASSAHYQANSTMSGYNTGYQSNPGTTTYPGGTTTTSYSMPTGGTTYPASGNVSGYPGTTNVSYPSGGTTYPATGTSYPATGTTYPATGNTTYPTTGTTYPSGSNVTSHLPTGTTYPATGTTYPATGTSYPTTGTTYPTTGTSYPGASITYPQTGGITTSPTPGGISYPGSPSHQSGPITFPATNTAGATTVTTTTSNYPGQHVTANSKFPASGATTYPANSTTYPGTHTISGMPGYNTSGLSHQVYHPENTEYVMPSRSLRGGMRPLYDMHQVRTYEAAPVFHSAPYVVDGGETHLTREVHESSLHKSASLVSDDGAHKKKHSSKNTQGKKKFCC